MPRGRYQQKQWEDRQAAILGALETLSAERGFASVTMDDLAEAVGISKATLYQHFESKDAMLAHLMAQHEDRFVAWMEGLAGQPPLERLRQVVRYLMEGHITPLRRLISMGREEMLPVFYNSPDLMTRHDRIIDRLVAAIREGQADGSIVPDLTPRVIITAMLALSNVTTGEFRQTRWSQQLQAEENYADQIVRIFERAIRT